MLLEKNREGLGMAMGGTEAGPGLGDGAAEGASRTQTPPAKLFQVLPLARHSDRA